MTEVREEYEISISTIQKRLREAGLFGSKPRKNPYLSQTSSVKFCKDSLILDFEKFFIGGGSYMNSIPIVVSHGTTRVIYSHFVQHYFPSLWPYAHADCSE